MLAHGLQVLSQTAAGAGVFPQLSTVLPTGRAAFISVSS